MDLTVTHLMVIDFNSVSIILLNRINKYLTKGKNICAVFLTSIITANAMILAKQNKKNYAKHYCRTGSAKGLNQFNFH